MKNNNTIRYNKNNEKIPLKQYFAPTIQVTLFEIENSIATASTQGIIGNAPTDIQVEDWTKKEDTEFFDF
ncbi:hypothetical protein [Sphingobacterium bovistauri]|uniref:Uncharacterized protein n=1 Tax=Sphingobacterium bovistauri TaxID=2781959 RepID=A0ABS7Z649_9SPHI|nr:hypothetical protein [Sphingobacterium bovistauri]MCA5004404.1 hypothetical protein [Sphingobacterium bovistauri]